jgi:rubrerythrin
MTTSKLWWNEVKNNSDKFNDWLIKQYRGEITAATRIKEFAKVYATDIHDIKILNVIANQESKHAAWVLDLLVARGINPSIERAEERYWKETLPEIESFETGAAVGAHAEAMRLERIKVICEDDSAPNDVRDVFQKILHEEIFHEKAFRNMAGVEAMMATSDAHNKGLELLGLEI